MNNQLTRMSETEMTPLQVAEVFVQSGMFPDAKSVATAASKLIVGRGLGLTDYDSMAGLHIIKGKVVLASNTMAAAIKHSGKYDYRAKTTESECTITFYSVNAGKREEIGSTTFSMQDAQNAGLRGDNWRKWPKAMLFARAISAGYREHCPDALGSAPVYVHEHGESEIPESPKPAAAPQRSTPQIEEVIEETEMSPKELLVDIVQTWCSCDTPASCYESCKKVMLSLGIPVDGSATDEQISSAIEYVSENMAKNKSFDEVFEVFGEVEEKVEDPWG